MSTIPGTPPPTPNVSRVVTVPTFDLAKSEQAISFMQNFDVTPYMDATKTHTEVRQWMPPSKTHMIRALFFGIVAACAYKTAHKYIALGLGVAAVVTLIVGSHSKQIQASKDFKAFSTSCDALAQHFFDAFTAKATFMVEQAKEKKNGWTMKYDSRLALQYATSNDANFNTSVITGEMKLWRAAHKFLTDAANLLKVDQIDQGSPYLNAVLAKVSTAKDLLLTGQSPVATEQKNATYICYRAEGAEMWPAPPAKA